MSATITLAPFWTNSLAEAAPMPLAPPVIIATFPWSLQDNVVYIIFMKNTSDRLS